MKNIVFLGNRDEYNLYKLIHDRICEVKNIKSKLIFKEKIENNEDILFSKICFHKNNNLKIDENYYNLSEFTFSSLLDLFNINLSNKKVLLVSTNNFFPSIYSFLKKINLKKIDLIGLDVDKKYKLYKGDYFKSFLDVNSIKEVDLIINLIELGDLNSVDFSLLKNFENLKVNIAFDIVNKPFETTFLKFFKLKNSKIISGMYYTILEILILLSLVFDRKDIIYYEFLENIYNFLDKKFQNKIYNSIDEIKTSPDFIKLLKRGEKYNE